MARPPVDTTRVQAVYDLYVSDPTLTYEDVAAKLSLSRGQVAHDLSRYRKEHGLTSRDMLTRKQDATRTSVPKSGIMESSVEDRRESQEPHQRRRAPARRVLMRGAVMDIECTDFGTEGYAGYVICCSVLPLDEDDVQTLEIRYDEHGDDRRLVQEIRDLLGTFDILVGHNLQAFDLNYLNSRLMFHGMPVLNTSLVFDTYQVAKSLAIKTRKSLGNLIDYFGLEGTKTSIYRTSWNNVRSPYLGEFTDAMKDIVFHCEQDVIANRNLFDVMYPYALSMRANPFKVSKMMAMGWSEDQMQ